MNKEEIIGKRTRYSAMDHSMCGEHYRSATDEHRNKHLPKEDMADQDMIEAMIARLGDGFAFKAGRSNLLFSGFVVKSDVNDYEKATKYFDGKLLVAEDFSKKYFGDEICISNDGYFDVSGYCGLSDKYDLYFNEEKGIGVVTPKEVHPFSDNNEKDVEYISRMEGFFNHPYWNEPHNNTEQSRVVIDRRHMVASESENWRVTYCESIHDPSIASAYDKNGNLVLYSTYLWQKFGLVSEKINNILFASYDMGKRWEVVAEFESLSVGTLIEIKGLIYIIGTCARKLVVGRYDPSDGSVASSTIDITIDVQKGLGGPGTATIHNGRIYKCGTLCVVSADINDDLLEYSSWTESTPVRELFTPEWKKEVKVIDNDVVASCEEWEEGSVVPGKDGKMYVVYRQNKSVGYAVLFELSPDGRTLSYVTECNGKELFAKSLIRIPSSIARHAIKFDKRTGYYLSLMSIYANKDAAIGSTRHQRNVMALVVSEDLVEWRIVDNLLVEREMINPTLAIYAHGFQYADFIIIGENIHFVVRETTGDTIRNFHEAPEMTFYTLGGYRRMLQK